MASVLIIDVARLSCLITADVRHISEQLSHRSLPLSSSSDPASSPSSPSSASSPARSEKTRTATIVLRGATQNRLDDLERAIDDGVNVIKALLKEAPYPALYVKSFTTQRVRLFTLIDRTTC